MKKIFGYALGLVAALTFAGAIATTANADGSSADATSGSASGSSAATSSVVVPSDDTGYYAGDGMVDMTSSSSASSSSTKPMTVKKTVKKSVKKAVKREKAVAKDKRIRVRKHYRKDARVIYLEKGRKGEEVTLCNRKGKVVKKCRVKKNGKFDIRLTRKEAKKLDKYGKDFLLQGKEKGYKAYLLKVKIEK